VGGEVRAWSLGPGAQGTHREDDACMTALAFQADGRGLVSLSSTGRVQTWDPVDGPSSSGWMLPDAQAWFGPHGHMLAGTTPSSPAITLYDVTGGYPVGRLVPRLSDHEPGPCRALAFTPDEGWLGAVVLADLGNFAVVRFRAGAQAPGTWVEGFNSPASLALAPDGAIAVVGCHAAVGEADVLVGDMTRGERIATLRWHCDHVGAVAYAPDGSGIATADAGGSVAWWEAGSFRRGWEANLPVALTDLAFTRRGAALVARGVDGSLWIWRTADGALLEHILPAWWGAQRTDAGPRGLAVSPTSEGAAVAVAPRGVRFHRLTQGA
jgi:WD40 repeat protein